MSERLLDAVAAQGFLPSFAPSFLDDHAHRMINDPKIALVELVANCWDAGADRVDITWPEEAAPYPFGIADNGTGMTYGQFIERWSQINYNRLASQGSDVEFPGDNQPSHRKAYGRNGKGRHSMFCFTNRYRVTTWRDGTEHRFSVQRSESISRAPWIIEHEASRPRAGHGTELSGTISRNHLTLPQVRDLIGSKFVTDPAFHVFLNDVAVDFTDLQHLTDRRVISVPGVGEFVVSQVDTQRTSRTSDPHGVAWWVNHRLVGEPSWKDFTEDSFLDRRTVEAKRYTFVVEADVLADAVNEDWSGFYDTPHRQAACAVVTEHIRSRIQELTKDLQKSRKRSVIARNRADVTELPVGSRQFVGKTVDDLQARMPSISEVILSHTVAVLANLEKARTGYTLMAQLAQLGPRDLDGLSQILDQWSVQDARLVLNELERRLTLVNRLEKLVEDPHSDELHDIHPLFVRGLWMFGPEYESVHFTSNQSLLSVIRRFFGGEANELENPQRRPDIVAVPDGTVSVSSCDSFDDRAEVGGVDRILIVELKRGGKRIGQTEVTQGWTYATELRRSGKVQSNTKITVFVLGTEVAPEISDKVTVGDTVVITPRTYGVVLRQAHARTFDLHQRISSAHWEEIADPDVEEVISAPWQEVLAPLGVS